ncbi:MAG: hypothetical protein SH856_00880 [Flavobacteriales bacterium]|nr:hypothetical protein [Flavobacteriales bacterium]
MSVLEEKNTTENEVSTAGILQAQFRIRAFRAIEDHGSCQKFYEGHVGVLSEYGITNLRTSESKWLNDENVWVVLAEDMEGNTVGGLRIHKYTGQQSIPLIEALVELDPKIVNSFDKARPEGTAEVCALWNAKKVLGKGISPLLCMCSVVIVRRIGLKSFYCFSAPYTEKMIKTNGCIDLEEVGDKGRFHYPSEKYISIVLFNPDVGKLEFAAAFNKSRIQSLCSQPEQTFNETSARGDFLVKYDLRCS